MVAWLEKSEIWSVLVVLPTVTALETQAGQLTLPFRPKLPEAMVVAMPRFQAWIQANPNDPAAQMLQRSGMWAFVVGMLLVGTLLTLAWPGFCLVWFGLLGKGRTPPDRARDDAEPMGFAGR